MGVPLLIIGTTGGKFLPKNGPWMVAVKQLFGVMLLAIAIVLISRFSSDVVILSLWAVLSLTLAIHYGALENAINARQRLRKTGAFILLLYAIALFCGAMTGAQDPLDPLQNIYHKGDTPSLIATLNTPLFTKVSGLAEIQQNIKKAQLNNQITILDISADWCASCKVMEKTIFRDLDVHAAFASFNALQFDISKQTDAQSKWLDNKQIFGPPAILFLDKNGKELRHLRLLGEINKTQLLSALQRVKTSA